MEKVTKEAAEEECLTMSVERAAKIMGSGRNQMYELCRAGKVPTVRLNRRILVLVKPFMRMLEGAA
jgi:hypothetical protein